MIFLQVWVLWTTLLCQTLPETSSSDSISCPGSHSSVEPELWAKVAAPKCLICHTHGGDAEVSEFLLIDPAKVPTEQRPVAMRQNLAAFAQMATIREQGQSKLLQKVIGQLDHGGAVVLELDSPEYRLLADFVERANGTTTNKSSMGDAESPEHPFFAGVTRIDDRQLLRRATLSLAGRLPTNAESQTIAKDGPSALPTILRQVMQEDAFYDRLREGFNDVFLTLGINGNADQTVLSYEHFEKTRHWYQDYDLSHISDADQRQRTQWRMADQYRLAILGETMKLIEHIVRHDRPFTEIVTADYIMVSPYSARGYGVFEQVKDQFQNLDDPYEYVPVRLKSLVGRSESQNQDSETGFYPHAGVLSTFQYLTRYPTTETNRNRLRARMYYQHFLGIDVLELAARVSDAAAVTAQYQVPTMEAAECVVCHRTLDPVAGLFQDYWRFADEGVYGKRKDGWFTDMFAAGFEGEDLPPEERWRALQWLGGRTVKDPRFAIAMTEHVYFILTGRRVLLPPKDFENPFYPARLRAYRELRQKTEQIAQRFAENNFSLKGVFIDWIMSDFYRADGLEVTVDDPCRLVELDELGLVRMLSPEQLERKIAAVFGEKWGRLEDQLALLYGGIDSKEVTERATDPSGAIGAIQRTMSNDVACRHVARDFARPAAERLLFPYIDPAVAPGASPESDERIRATIVHLHERILGRYEAMDSGEVTRTFQLFRDLVQDAQATAGLEKREIYYCRPNPENSGPEADDPLYTIRAWRGVVTYLLRRPEFLYE
ncbi:MAG: hypothetical protein JNL67_20845 [Planctomycetaceae bacterium]|nr:hypothetical protein [Planctomycetaceae bacterium]